VNEITEAIIGCAYTVGNTLGPGFLEKVYENALAHELRKSWLDVKLQHPIKVEYDGVVVGEYFADLLVENQVIIELKTVNQFNTAHMAQALNYLKATNLKICLLINFGKPKIQIKRIIND
jgi:GxxExxY protein